VSHLGEAASLPLTPG